MTTSSKVLIIEDDLALRLAIKRILSLQFETFEAGSVSEARNWSENSVNIQLAVILVDSRLPDGSGLELLPILQRHFPSAALIVMTADADYSPAVKAIDAGADDYLVKTDRLAAELQIRIPIARANAARRNALLSSEDHCILPLPRSISDLSPTSFETFLDTANRQYIERTLVLCQGDLIRSAKMLGMGRSTLFAKIAELRVDRSSQETHQ